MRDYLMDCVKVRRGKWDKAYIIGGFPLISDRERILKEYGAREIFISTTKEECIARLDACDDGRDKEAWRGYIDEWWRLSKL
jgi:NAD(P)H-flavin reductase